MMNNKSGDAARLTPPYTAGGLPSRYLLAVILFSMIHIVPAIAGTVDDYWAPWVTKLTTSSATINWRGETDGLGVIDYATASYYDAHKRFNETVSCRTAATYQHVHLAGLNHNTSYVYRVRPSGNPAAFENRSFRTMPIRGRFTFVVISDPQEGHTYSEERRFKYVADAVAKETDVLFILHGGDNAGHDDKALWAKYFHVADGMLAKFPIFPCIGNHEYHDPSNSDNPPTPANQYHWSYDVPLHYSFDCCKVRFVVLDSPDPNNHNGDDPHTSLALANSQAPWLRQQLAQRMAGTFTINHHPIWDEGRTIINPDLQPWENLYLKYRISANFAGHTHDYQRYMDERIPYFVCGIGGGRCADLVGPFARGYRCGNCRNLGYIRVTVDPVKNIGTAREVIVGYVLEDDSDEIPHLYDPPIIGDAVTFPLRR